MLARIKTALRTLLHRTNVERELDEELRHHVERQTEQNIRLGMNPEEARYAALRAFGGLDQTKERSRDARGVRRLEELGRDLRYGARMLLKQPGFTLIAVLTLSLGIGANTAIFSIVNAVLLRPFPYKAPERLVILLERVSAGGGFSPSYPNFADWRTHNTVFDSISAVRTNESFNFTGTGEPERLRGRLVSAEFFSTLGVRPLLGRDFLSEEDRPGATPAAILSYGLWQRRFGADPSIIGQQLTLNNQSFTIIGISPVDFQFGEEAGVTVPIGLQAERFRLRGRDPGTGVVARLKPNVSQQQAETELNMIDARLEQQYPESNKGRRVRITPLHESFVGDVRQPLLILLGSVGLVLLIACANVANLLLVRSSTRRKEMAVRVALGAQSGNVLRLVIGQGMKLALAGVALGLVASVALTRTIKNQLFGVSTTDPATFAAIALLLALVALLACFVPARRATKVDPTVALRFE